MYAKDSRICDDHQDERDTGCDFSVVGIGIEPAVDMLGDSSIQVDNGVVVDEYCQTNVGGIYAAGDVTNHFHPVFGRHIRVERWQNAVKQGAVRAQHVWQAHRVRRDPLVRV